MYTDLLIKIKNAQQARKDSLKTYYSKMDLAIAEILAHQKYIKSVEKKGRLPKRVLEIFLNEPGKGKAIQDVRFISIPSRRIYTKYKDLKSVKQGFGMGIISTPKGVMTTKEAKKQKVGGQILLEIW